MPMILDLCGFERCDSEFRVTSIDDSNFELRLCTRPSPLPDGKINPFQSKAFVPLQQARVWQIRCGPRRTPKQTQRQTRSRQGNGSSHRGTARFRYGGEDGSRGSSSRFVRFRGLLCMPGSPAPAVGDATEPGTVWVQRRTVVEGGDKSS